VYHTNSRGFRGPEFEPGREGDRLRLMFLGDSFTFGEGVRFEDTYPEVTAGLLAKQGGGDRRVEAYNFGVGGYNTAQSLQLLRMVLAEFSPDVVVLGYVLNDAEPSLIELDPATETVRRRPREQVVPEGTADPVPPESFPYQLRTARLVWQFFANRRRSRATIDHYHALFAPESPGWRASRRALRGIGEACRLREIPFVVVLFPILVDLTEDYPFGEIHERVSREVAAAGGIPVDLFPTLEGMNARDLWVHPTDQHPNERVHALAARSIAEQLARLPQVAARRSSGTVGAAGRSGAP